MGGRWQRSGDTNTHVRRGESRGERIMKAARIYDKGFIHTYSVAGIKTQIVSGRAAGFGRGARFFVWEVSRHHCTQDTLRSVISPRSTHAPRKRALKQTKVNAWDACYDKGAPLFSLASSI